MVEAYSKMDVSEDKLSEADFIILASQLEAQELESCGSMPAEIYAQLLAIYLVTDDLCNFKLLWKRMPATCRQSTPELNAVWTVGNALWKKDYPKFYTAVDHAWPDYLKSVMSCLLEKVRQHALELVSSAYSSVSLLDYSHSVGLAAAEAVKVAEDKGWKVDCVNEDPTLGMVYPVKTRPSADEYISNQKHLTQLAEFVSFLEN